MAAGCKGPRAYLELVPWKVWKVWKVHGNDTEKPIEPQCYMVTHMSTMSMNVNDINYTQSGDPIWPMPW